MISSCSFSFVVILNNFKLNSLRDTLNLLAQPKKPEKKRKYDFVKLVKAGTFHHLFVNMMHCRFFVLSKLKSKHLSILHAICSQMASCALCLGDYPFILVKNLKVSVDAIFQINGKMNQHNKIAYNKPTVISDWCQTII